MKARRRYPTAVDPARVGRYPALAKAGGGYVWDVHVKKVRVTEWPVELLRRPRRDRHTIRRFLAPDAPANRLEILRGTAKARSDKPLSRPVKDAGARRR